MLRHGDTLISSDWHILHQNIYYMVSEARERLTGDTNGKPESETELLAAENAIYSRLLEELKGQVGEIRRFLHLGDFIFAKKQKTRDVVRTIQRHISPISDFFDLLKANQVETILIAGNHDQLKPEDRKLLSIWFDDIVDFVWEENVLYCHYPFGYHMAKVQADEEDRGYLYRMPRQFKRLDEKLTEDWNGEPLINYHGHIHAQVFDYPVTDVEYRNACIDYADANSIEEA